MLVPINQMQYMVMFEDRTLILDFLDINVEPNEAPKYLHFQMWNKNMIAKFELAEVFLNKDETVKSVLYRGNFGGQEWKASIHNIPPQDMFKD